MNRDFMDERVWKSLESKVWLILSNPWHVYDAVDSVVHGRGALRNSPMKRNRFSQQNANSFLQLTLHCTQVVEKKETLRKAPPKLLSRRIRRRASPSSKKT